MSELGQGAEPDLSQVVKAVLFVLLAILCLDAMSVTVRLLLPRYSALELSAYRNILGILPSLAVMIWVGEEDRIYVLYDDTIYTDGWNAFTDEWQEGDPVDDPTIVPPPGFYQPQRGFGLIWREQPMVRERLGWAVAPEAGGDTAVQRTSYYKYNHTYLKALDNNVWHLFPERSDWEKLVPDTIN